MTADSTAFTHLDSSGKVRMVDVSEKAVTHRAATAISDVVLGESILSQLQGDEIHLKKGAVFQTAILAGIMGAKETSRLIPLCHPLPLDKCTVTVDPISATTVRVTCVAQCAGKTGVEMEALTGASIAALTLYDMCKALSHTIVIGPTRLLEKTGGRSGDYKFQESV